MQVMKESVYFCQLSVCLTQQNQMWVEKKVILKFCLRHQLTLDQDYLEKQKGVVEEWILEDLLFQRGKFM